jgi:predicted nucleic-acid-binding protein
MRWRRPSAPVGRGSEGRRHRELEFSDVDRCLAALRRYKAAKGDFADYLIAQETWDRGGDALVTFDATHLAEEGFIAPK